MKETKIISAFPGTGKTHLFNSTDLFVLDSDSSYFDKSNFPQNYIEHIKSYMGKVDLILVSSHKEVRQELKKNKLDFYLVYPSINLKNEYLRRYKERGSSKGFIGFLDRNWNDFIIDLSKQTGCINYPLHKGEYLNTLTDSLIKK